MFLPLFSVIERDSFLLRLSNDTEWVLNFSDKRHTIFTINRMNNQYFQLTSFHFVFVFFGGGEEGDVLKLHGGGKFYIFHGVARWFYIWDTGRKRRSLCPRIYCSWYALFCCKISIRYFPFSLVKTNAIEGCTTIRQPLPVLTSRNAVMFFAAPRLVCRKGWKTILSFVFHLDFCTIVYHSSLGHDKSVLVVLSATFFTGCHTRLQAP